LSPHRDEPQNHPGEHTEKVRIGHDPRLIAGERQSTNGVFESDFQQTEDRNAPCDSILVVDDQAYDGGRS
jgi:hypothetical protein